MQIQSRYIEKQVLNTLKYIHLASKKCDTLDIVEAKKKLLVHREYNLVFIGKVVGTLKKNMCCQTDTWKK